MMNAAQRAVAVAAFGATCRSSLYSQAFPILPRGNQILASSFSRAAASCSSSLASSAHHFFSDTPSISISDAFDGGNIQFLESRQEQDTTIVSLNIKPDPFTELEQVQHLQHFFFRSTVNNTPMKCKYVIQNAGETSYASAWNGYTVFYSSTPSDPNSWTRNTETTYNKDGTLSWTHTHHSQSECIMYFAYFPPYSYERHLQLIAKCGEYAHVQSLGQSLDGRELECIIVGRGSQKCWILHRQHPGESMAEFYAEGLLERLLGLERNGSVDGTVASILEKYTFYIVPNMNPDGAVRGHLRTNAIGSNLNREWASSGVKGEDDYYEAPTMERSPEVYSVLRAMDETGVDAFMDVHGDEELPFNFIAGAEGCPNWGPRLQALQGAFLAAYARANSDMQIPVSYEPEEPGEGRLNTCSNQIATRFDCLGVTLEQPFKDCLSHPDPQRGWNPARAKLLGASVLDALLYVHPYLRDETDFWNELPQEDAYVRPTDKY